MLTTTRHWIGERGSSRVGRSTIRTSTLASPRRVGRSASCATSTYSISMTLLPRRVTTSRHSSAMPRLDTATRSMLHASDMALAAGSRATAVGHSRARSGRRTSGTFHARRTIAGGGRDNALRSCRRWKRTSTACRRSRPARDAAAHGPRSGRRRPRSRTLRDATPRRVAASLMITARPATTCMSQPRHALPTRRA